MSLKRFGPSSSQNRPKISILIPFRSDNKERKHTLKWLLKYWRYQLPDAEIILGHSHRKIFCKTEALNDAASRAKGKVLVILDADAYLSGDVIEKCADRILEDLDDRLWYVPYRNLFRLNRKTTNRVLSSDPKNPLEIPSPPPIEDLDDDGLRSHYGHRYGAMIMIFPREALSAIGCFDERFQGWGGEDVSLLRALDTLYGKHKLTKNDVLHLWHPRLGDSFETRTWKGQSRFNPNNQLAMQYHQATRRPSQMRTLVQEGCVVRRHHGLIDKLRDVILDLLEKYR